MDDRHEVRNPVVENRLHTLGGILGENLKDTDYGFMLMLFGKEDTPEEHNLFYVSSMDREGVLKAMQEFIDKQLLGS